MKKNIAVILVTIIIATAFPFTGTAAANEPISLLWVGNQLTCDSKVNVADQVSALYQTAFPDSNFSVKKISANDASLADLCDEAEAAMESKKYDYVVLQGMLWREELLPQLEESVGRLCDGARSLGAEPILFNPLFLGLDGIPNADHTTWATPMYEKVAADNGIVLVNAAEAALYCYQTLPHVSLFDYNWTATRRYPNWDAGFYSACVFLSTVFNMRVKQGYRDQEIHAPVLGQAAWEYLSHKTIYDKAPAKYRPAGDVNADWRVDVHDILTVRDSIFGDVELTPTDFDAADVTRDGVLDIDDILGIIDYIFQPLPIEDAPLPAITLPSNPENAVTMLWAGNSLTSWAKIYQQVKQLCEMHMDRVIMYEDVTKGGAPLETHIDEIMYLTRYKTFDYVVVHDIVGDPAKVIETISQVGAQCRASGAQLVVYNPGVFATEGKPNQHYHDFISHPTYKTAAEANNAIYVDAGGAFIYAYEKMPGVQLFESDDAHHNWTGGYLTACVFAGVLFDLRITAICPENDMGDLAIPLADRAWEFVKEGRAST
ncbi:MAG: dockerin type I repeat-containing protein [Clostridia bacterium]|nr:dockerin type I repeat-containing protein [Clostridia bacterium]